MSAETISSGPVLARRIGPNALPLAIVVIAAVFAIADPAFLGLDNLIGIVRQVALIGIMATCTTFVIMTGGVDLSVGPVLAISGLVSFDCLEAGLPLPIVFSPGSRRALWWGWRTGW